MAEFLKETQLISAIEEMINNADEFLYIISPYIKLHDRIKDRLREKKNQPEVHIVFIFGKNEQEVHKSLSLDDFNFLKEFPNIYIGYEKRLHAKYYASEDHSIITSMNLHEFSQNNNIEGGIRLKSKKWLSISSDKADEEAFEYFDSVINNAEVIYDKQPQFKSAFLGLATTYSHSDVITDQSETFFKGKELSGKRYTRPVPVAQVPSVNNQEAQGYCIRTGKPIPFNPKSPFSAEAYKSWSRYKDENYKEKYCHYSVEPSNGETSYAKPILRKNWNKSKS